MKNRWIIVPPLLLSVLLIASCDPVHGVAADDAPSRRMIVVLGAEGAPEYGTMFRAWTTHWEQAAAHGGIPVQVIGSDDDASVDDRDRLQSMLAETDRNASDDLWLVLIGHGTFDGRNAKFNLRGPDVTAVELSEWLEPFQRPQIVVNCASSSAPFLNRLSGPNRVIVTATRSGSQLNFSRFGQFLADTVASEAADLDKDGQTSLLEAWLIASRRTDEFYASDGRLATEHSLLDDNGDGKGTRADAFRGIRPAGKSSGELLDGFRAHQIHLLRSPAEQQLPMALRLRRDQLELQVVQLRAQKDSMDEAVYLQQLEPLLVSLAELYEQAERSETP